MWVIDVLGLFLTYTTRHWQTSRWLVQELMVYTVDHCIYSYRLSNLDHWYAWLIFDMLSMGVCTHYGAKWAQIEKWPCISGVHDKIFMKSGHQIACRDTKHLENFNDIDTTSNDLEMTFNSVSSTYLILGPSYCPHNNTIMDITPPYYLGHHTLVYICKKIWSEKATFDIFYEGWYENIYLLFLWKNQLPYEDQNHIIRFGSRRRYH